MKPIPFITGVKNITPQRTDGRKRVYCAESFWQKFVGLMFKKDFEGEMIFKFKKPTSIFIHSFFMKFDIDVVCYNENNKVIKIVKLAPWKIMCVKNVKWFLEKKSA